MLASLDLMTSSFMKTFSFVSTSNILPGFSLPCRNRKNIKFYSPLTLTQCLLGNFPCFFVFKINLFQKKKSDIPSVSNSLDPDQARYFVRPDLGPYCLQRLSSDRLLKISFRNTFSVKQYGSRSDPTFCRARSGSKLSAKVFNRLTFENFFQKYHQCRTVWIQIRPIILLGQIWVQTVCKGYQQTDF